MLQMFKWKLTCGVSFWDGSGCNGDVKIVKEALSSLEFQKKEETSRSLEVAPLSTHVVPAEGKQ